jgi:glycosyltransferase involved in cell wall biosynthesis
MADKKRIILVGSVPPPYHGSAVYFFNLLNSKIKDEFDVTHLDISDHRDMENLSRLDFVNVYLALKNIFKLIILHRKHNPDLVYIPVASNFLPYLRDGLFILTTSIFSKAKIVIQLHEGKYFREEFYNNSNSIVKYFIKKTLGKVDTAIVYSEKLKYVFEGFVDNIRLCPNGIETKTVFNNHVKEKKSGEKIVAGYQGNLFESKGVLDLLNAASIVLQKNKNIEFQIVGPWINREKHTKAEAEKIIIENNLEDKIKFLGIVTGNEKEKILMQTDVFVFPTKYPFEGFPLVILEAMQAQCPVISTKDVGAIEDMVDDGKTGILVDKKNPAQISQAIVKLIEDPDLRLSMGKAGRAKFEQLYTLDINVNNMISIFNDTLKAHK